MTTIVAGGAGFVGSYLCDRRITEGEEVICLDNLVTGRIANIARPLGRSGLRFLHDDIVEPVPADDLTQRRPDISLAKAVLNWEPRVPVVVGLERTIAYFRDEQSWASSSRREAEPKLAQLAG